MFATPARHNAMLVVGLDIGGANLKAATSDGAAVDRPFALWKHPERLSSELRSLIESLPKADAIAVTMTGELADCFVSKAEGVRSIVAAVQAAADVPVRFWQTGGEFLVASDAVELPRLVAAANWHALATFCGRVAPHGPGLLIDIGSTTTDLIPLLDGQVHSDGMTDLERLRSGELVYSGATRTPLCAFGSTVRVAGNDMPLAAELFATSRDVHLLLGNLPEDPIDSDTADGRPATCNFAMARLSRMACSDPDEIGNEFLHQFAEALAERQRRIINDALEQVLCRLDHPPHVLLSGSGSFIAERILGDMPNSSFSDVTLLANLFAKHVARSACAFAVAKLAAERLTL
ncbi:MAG: H4MPT-linked C1 transfer pathway protein [Planctomycetota bacterium]|nr:H4MPT-linked C1 transfer pathway protein [Planctomycetota bacterium]